MKSEDASLCFRFPSAPKAIQHPQDVCIFTHFAASGGGASSALQHSHYKAIEAYAIFSLCPQNHILKLQGGVEGASPPTYFLGIMGE